MTYEIREHPLLAGSWEVSCLGDDGKYVYIALFGGIGAEARAREYVALMEKKEAQNG